MYKYNENIGIGTRHWQVPEIKVSVSGEYWKKWYRCIPSFLFDSIVFPKTYRNRFSKTVIQTKPWKSWTVPPLVPMMPKNAVLRYLKRFGPELERKDKERGVRVMWSYRLLALLIKEMSDCLDSSHQLLIFMSQIICLLLFPQASCMSDLSLWTSAIGFSSEVSVLGLQRERWKDESVGSFSRV